MLLDPNAKWDMAPDEEYFMDMYSHRRSISPSPRGNDDNPHTPVMSQDTSPGEYLTAVTDDHNNVILSISNIKGGGLTETYKNPAVQDHQTTVVDRKPEPASIGKFTKTSKGKRNAGLLANRSRKKGKSYDFTTTSGDNKKNVRPEQKPLIIQALLEFGDSSPEAADNRTGVSSNATLAIDSRRSGLNLNNGVNNGRVNNSESIYDVIGPPSRTAATDGQNNHSIKDDDDDVNSRLGNVTVTSNNAVKDDDVMTNGYIKVNDASDAVTVTFTPFYMPTTGTDSQSSNVKKRTAPPPPFPVADTERSIGATSLATNTVTASETESFITSQIALSAFDKSSKSKAPPPPLSTELSEQTIPVKTPAPNIPSISVKTPAPSMQNPAFSLFRPLVVNHPDEFSFHSNDYDLTETEKREFDEQPSFFSSSYRKPQQSNLPTTLGGLVGGSKPPFPVKSFGQQNSNGGVIKMRPKSQFIYPLVAPEVEYKLVPGVYNRADVDTSNSVVKNKQFKTRLEILMNARSNSVSTSAVSSLSRVVNANRDISVSKLAKKGDTTAVTNEKNAPKKYKFLIEGIDTPAVEQTPMAMVNSIQDGFGVKDGKQIENIDATDGLVSGVVKGGGLERKGFSYLLDKKLASEVTRRATELAARKPHEVVAMQKDRQMAEESLLKEAKTKMHTEADERSFINEKGHSKDDDVGGRPTQREDVYDDVDGDDDNRRSELWNEIREQLKKRQNAGGATNRMDINKRQNDGGATNQMDINKRQNAGGATNRMEMNRNISNGPTNAPPALHVSNSMSQHSMYERAGRSAERVPSDANKYWIDDMKFGSTNIASATTKHKQSVLNGTSLSKLTSPEQRQFRPSITNNNIEISIEQAPPIDTKNATVQIPPSYPHDLEITDYSMTTQLNSNRNSPTLPSAGGIRVKNPRQQIRSDTADPSVENSSSHYNTERLQPADARSIGLGFNEPSQTTAAAAGYDSTQFIHDTIMANESSAAAASGPSSRSAAATNSNDTTIKLRVPTTTVTVQHASADSVESNKHNGVLSSHDRDEISYNSYRDVLEADRIDGSRHDEAGKPLISTVDDHSNTRRTPHGQSGGAQSNAKTTWTQPPDPDYSDRFYSSSSDEEESISSSSILLFPAEDKRRSALQQDTVGSVTAVSWTLQGRGVRPVRKSTKSNGRLLGYPSRDNNLYNGEKLPISAHATGHQPIRLYGERHSVTVEISSSGGEYSDISRPNSRLVSSPSNSRLVTSRRHSPSQHYDNSFTNNHRLSDIRESGRHFGCITNVRSSRRRQNNNTSNDEREPGDFEEEVPHHSHPPRRRNSCRHIARVVVNGDPFETIAFSDSEPIRVYTPVAVASQAYGPPSVQVTPVRLESFRRKNARFDSMQRNLQSGRQSEDSFRRRHRDAGISTRDASDHVTPRPKAGDGRGSTPGGFEFQYDLQPGDVMGIDPCLEDVRKKGNQYRVEMKLNALHSRPASRMTAVSVNGQYENNVSEILSTNLHVGGLDGFRHPDYTNRASPYSDSRTGILSSRHRPDGHSPPEYNGLLVRVPSAFEDTDRLPKSYDASAFTTSPTASDNFVIKSFTPSLSMGDFSKLPRPAARRARNAATATAGVNGGQPIDRDRVEFDIELQKLAREIDYITNQSDQGYGTSKNFGGAVNVFTDSSEAPMYAMKVIIID